MKKVWQQIRCIGRFCIQHAKIIKYIISFIIFVTIIYMSVSTSIFTSLFDPKNAHVVSATTSIATIFTVLVAIYQIRQANKIHCESSKHMTIRESVEIAKLFQEKLINYICLITEAHKSTTFMPYIDRVLEDFDYEFTSQEALALFGVDCLEEYNKIALQSMNPHKIYALLCTYVPKEYEYDLKEASQEGTEAKLWEGNILAAYLNMINETMNTLEWIAMLLNTGAADDMVIYQSLHQSLLGFIRLSYFYISKYNSDNNDVDKYYCNLIELYTRWNNYRRTKISEFNDAKTEIEKISKRATEKGKKLVRSSKQNAVTKPPAIK